MHDARQLVFEVKRFTQWAVGLGLVAERRVSEWSEPVQATTLPAAPDWRTESWRASALFWAALYFILTTSLDIEIPNDLLTKVEAHLVVAIAIYNARREWNKRKRG